jgi:hypothetical protein
LVSAAALALGGGTLALIEPGLQRARLSGGAREVMHGVARAVLDGTLPTQDAARNAAMAGLLERIDALVGGLPPHAQAELSQLLALLSSAGGRRLLAGISDPWPVAARADIEAGLQSMRVSGISLRQQAYQALHEIVGSAYFSDASTWAAMGYPGPTAI